MNRQEKLIFQYLKKNKEATGLELWRKCGVMSWAKIISNLREKLQDTNYVIIKERVKVYSKFAGKKVSVMKYRLGRKN